MIRLLLLAAAGVIGYHVARENSTGLAQIRSLLGGGEPPRPQGKKQIRSGKRS